MYYYNLSEPFYYSKNVKKGHINFFSYSAANKALLFSKTKPRYAFFIFDNWPIGMVEKSCWVAKKSHVGNLDFVRREKKNFSPKNCEKFFFGEIFFLLINDKYTFHLKGLSRKIWNFLSLWTVGDKRMTLGPKLGCFFKQPLRPPCWPQASDTLHISLFNQYDENAIGVFSKCEKS